MRKILFLLTCLFLFGCCIPFEYHPDMIGYWDEINSGVFDIKVIKSGEYKEVDNVKIGQDDGGLFFVERESEGVGKKYYVLGNIEIIDRIK